ncbi:MAG: 4Fe-4S binding protein [Bacteroidales bacterium]|nr:4Fe-4S binding protein [Bacteroidales bacterium]
MHNFSNDNPLVYTVKGLCRVCYTCVRECPVKAIKIISGQAEIITERCIACGNCVIVCSQGAKTYYSSIEKVEDILLNNKQKILCVAPSFAAEFTEIENYRIFVGMAKELGFDLVTEVSFGADLVAQAYKNVFENESTKTIITSDCPAIVNYIKQYHPNLVEFLAPIVSPAIAIAKVLKKKYNNDAQLVFVGPCVAKKAESESFDENLTFSELRLMFEKHNIIPDRVTAADFDKPISGKGAFFPVNHGLLKSLNKTEGFGKGEVITAEGKTKFREAIQEFENGVLKNQHLELLCCDGCIEGPGMSVKGQKLVKRMKISEYVNNKLNKLDNEEWEKEKEQYSKLDLTREFCTNDQRLPQPNEYEINNILISMGKVKDKDMLNCGACGYETCKAYASAVVEGLAETEMCLPYAIEKLHKSNEELHQSNMQLSDTKVALKQSEKLASMGQLSAGIAHELNNPLGIITLYSSILKDELNNKSELFEDIEIINEQAERCKTIVEGLLNFARKNKVTLKETNIVEFIEKSFKSFVKPDDIQIEFNYDIKCQLVKLDVEQMMQAITNIEKNAVEAMPNGGLIAISINEVKGSFIIKISDTGAGIAKENLEKIFTPFFTTKGVNKGTGLGLPLVYGIVKMHKGKINVQSNNQPDNGSTGTTFTITLPK